MRIPSLLAFVALLTACGPAPEPQSPAGASEQPPAGVAAPKNAEAAAPAPPTAPAQTAVNVPPAIATLVAAADRSEDDRALDEGRHPAETLAFFGIAPGMKVADLGAGFGYTTELLARAVGPEGRVYGQNNRFVLEKFAEKGWTERLAKPINKNVVRLDREFDDPFPSDLHDLDAVINILFYHDTVWQKTDRDRMNRAIFAALKSGGIYGIVDHSGREGSGVSEAQTLHRIEEKTLREEVERAGFKLAASADFLRNPEDPRDWNAAPGAATKAGKRGTSDRFVLKFVKP